MTVPIVALLIASLVGSLHCVGMCGAFVAFAVGTGEESGWRSKAVLSMAYNGGRLVTYTALGAIGGALGAALNLGGEFVGVQRIAAVAAGVIMIVFGLTTLLRVMGVKLPKTPMPKFIHRVVGAGQMIAMGMKPMPRALTIGLLTTLLPCGWLYAYAAVAAGTASPVYGALTMAVFWLGTVPALAALGAGIQSLTGVLGRHMPAATAIAIVLVGLYTVIHRVDLSSAVYAQSPDTLSDQSPQHKAETIQQLPEGPLPCCVEDAD